MKLNRRRFLRATGVSLALPWLEALAPAAAPPARPRRRMVCICTPLGLHPPYFFPEKAGKDYRLSPYLDVLGDQARQMKTGLGAGERDKLDEYFTSVRELEQRLATAEKWSKRPKPRVKAKPPQNVTSPADLVGRARVWFDLIHLALQTD